MENLTDSHQNGSARSCEYEDDLLKWLPQDYSLRDEEGHYHLLLTASDHQLPMLINWIAIAFALEYLPSPRLLIHFQCDGSLTRRFVEKLLLQQCTPPPRRKTKKKPENQWRRIIHDRLGSTLELVKALDNTDYGALTFDLDAPWLRNMIAVFDFFGHGHGGGYSYDFISMGTIMDGKYDGRLITNFGAVFFKNSAAGKALADRAWWALNSDWDAPYPDQDYVTAALFDKTNLTQTPIDALRHTANLYKDDEMCAKFPKTCTLLGTGAHGNFTIQGLSGSYMYLPQPVAPRDCRRICSGATTLLQHCGIAYCLPVLLQLRNKANPVQNVRCNEIPEYILRDGDILKMVSGDIPHHGFKQALSGVFDSRTQQHMIDVVAKFVCPDRVNSFCRAYPKICSPSARIRGMFNITVHTRVVRNERKRLRKRFFVKNV